MMTSQDEFYETSKDDKNNDDCNKDCRSNIVSLKKMRRMAAGAEINGLQKSNDGW